MVQFKRVLLSQTLASGGVAIDLDQNDDASGNDLYFAACCGVESWIKANRICFNHKNNHVQVALVTGVFGVGIVSKLAVASSLLRMGTYLLRCVLKVEGFLVQDGVVSLVEGPAPEADVKYREALVSFIVTNYKGSMKARQEFSAMAEALFKDWNGGCHLDGNIFHYYTGLQPDKNNVVRRIARSMVSVMMSHSPCNPSLAKWTQLTQCSDWFFVSITGGVFPGLLKFAL